MSIVIWLVRDSSSFITSARVIVNHTPFARVISVRFLPLLSTFVWNVWSGRPSSWTPQTSTPSVTRLIDTKSLLQLTPYHGDKASFLGWKWSFLIASKPLHEGFKKIEDNMNQDFRTSRLSVGYLELSDQAYTLLALFCKDEACAYVRSAEDGNGYSSMASLLESTNSSECTKLLESVVRANIHITRSNWWTRKWWYPKGCCWPKGILF